METKTMTMADKLAKYYNDVRTYADLESKIKDLSALLENRQSFIETAEADKINIYPSGLLDEAAKQCNSINDELWSLRKTKNALESSLLEFEREAAARD